MVLVQCTEEPVRLRPILQSRRVLYGSHCFCPWSKQLGMACLADELACVIAMGKPLLKVNIGRLAVRVMSPRQA